MKYVKRFSSKSSNLGCVFEICLLRWVKIFYLDQHLAGHEISSGPDSDPNKATVQRNRSLKTSKIEKAKGKSPPHFEPQIIFSSNNEVHRLWGWIKHTVFVELRTVRREGDNSEIENTNETVDSARSSFSQALKGTLRNNKLLNSGQGQQCSFVFVPLFPCN